MNFYIVRQGPIVRKENDLFISSQVFDRSKEMPPSWEREEDLNSGDVIFHYVKGEIIGISRAHRRYYLSQVHRVNSEKLLDKAAYSVGTIYNKLEFPLLVNSIFPLLEPALPIGYEAFKKGRNEKRGHLYSCNELLAIKLLELISEHNRPKEQREFSVDLLIDQPKDTLSPLLKEAQTEAKQKIKKDLLKFQKSLRTLSEERCGLCHIDLPSLVRATYLKTWKDSTAEERLDPCNGMFLCRNHSVLYEQGYISFDETGKISISPILKEQDFFSYGLSAGTHVTFLDGNKQYFQWHRQHVFKKK